MPVVHGESVIGVFEHPDEALHAFHDFKRAGFAEEQLELLRRHEVPLLAQTENVEMQRRAGRGAMQGAIGGAFTGLAGACTGTFLVEVAPLWWAIVFGGALGAAIGTFFGPFLTLLQGQSEARPEASEQGRTVLVVRASDRRDEVMSLLQQEGAYDDREHAV